MVLKGEQHERHIAALSFRNGKPLPKVLSKHLPAGKDRRHIH